jgi:pimeloyl-ACP methyl ester carboxylesterase
MARSPISFTPQEIRMTVTTDSPVRGAVILLHGATLNARMWDPVRERLASTFTVIVPDLPGHGTRRDVPYTIAAAVGGVVEAVRSVAPAPVILVGDSLGGYTAMAAAAAVPAAQLRGLVLGGCSSNLRGTRLAPYLFNIAAQGTLRTILGEPRFYRMVGSQLAKKIDPTHAAAITGAGLRSQAFREAVWEINAVDFKERVAAIQVPIVFVNGDRDRGHLRFEAEFVAAAKSATTHRFANTEHGVSVWRSAEFAALTAEFARRAFASG